MGMTFQVVDQHLQKPVGRQGGFVDSKGSNGSIGPSVPNWVTVLGSPDRILGVLAKKDPSECHQARDRFWSLFVPRLVFCLCKMMFWSARWVA